MTISGSVKHILLCFHPLKNKRVTLNITCVHINSNRTKQELLLFQLQITSCLCFLKTGRQLLFGLDSGNKPANLSTTTLNFAQSSDRRRHFLICISKKLETTRVPRICRISLVNDSSCALKASLNTSRTRTLHTVHWWMHLVQQSRLIKNPVCFY